MVHTLSSYFAQLLIKSQAYCLCHQNGFTLVTRGSYWHTWPFSHLLRIRSLKQSSNDRWIQVTLSSLFHVCTCWHEIIPKPPGPSPIYSVCSNMNVFMVAYFSSQMHCINSYPELRKKRLPLTTGISIFCCCFGEKLAKKYLYMKPEIYTYVP